MSRRLFVCILLIFLTSFALVRGVTTYDSGWSCEGTTCECSAERCPYPGYEGLAPQGERIYNADIAEIKALPAPKLEWWLVEGPRKEVGVGIVIPVKAYDAEHAEEKFRELVKDQGISISSVTVAQIGVPTSDLEGEFILNDQGEKVYVPQETRAGDKWYISPEDPEWAWNPSEGKWVPSSEVPVIAELEEGSAPLPALQKPAAPQAQKGTLGAKVEGVAVYEGCRNKRFGLVGASNTVDKDSDGNKAASPMSEILRQSCPDSPVFLKAEGGYGPKKQKSLVSSLLAEHSDLDYVILDVSVNQIRESSLEDYTSDVIELAKMVKEKNINTKIVVLAPTPFKGPRYWSQAQQDKLDAFNQNLLTSALGRSDLINYPVDTYSALEDPPGSDSCGRYCKEDNLHFYDGTGRRKVIKTMLDTVFGSPTTTPVTNVPVSVTPANVPSSTVSSAELCDTPQGCREIDLVWLKIAIWVNAARNGYVFDTVKGGFRPYQETRPSVVVTPNIPSAKVGEITIANKLYKDILGNLPNQNLAKAMVANAKGESNLNVKTAGDGANPSCPNTGSYEQAGCYACETPGKRARAIVVPGIQQCTNCGCCSFGLWQYNLCGGLGDRFLEQYGNPSNKQEQLNIVHDYQKNIDFMVSYLQKTYPSEITQQRTVDEWVDWFVRNVERPAEASREIAKRQGFARDLENAGAFSEMIALPGTVPSVGLGVSPLGFSVAPVSIQGEKVFKFQNSILEQACRPESLTCLIPQENVGKQEIKVDAECPPGMVKAGSVCIDQYEAMLVDKNTGEVWSPFCNPGKEISRLRAVSIAGVYPQSTISQLEAKQACENAGKRICVSQQWLAACQGAEGRKYPYPNTRQAGVCKDEAKSPGGPTPQRTVAEFCTPGHEPFYEKQPVVDGKKVTWNIDPWMLHPKNNQQENSLDLTGSNFQCKTPEEVYDLVGNLDEWVADADGVFRGGFYHRTESASTENDGCLFTITAHPVQYYDYSLGFRCCANPIS